MISSTNRLSVSRNDLDRQAVLNLNHLAAAGILTSVYIRLDEHKGTLRAADKMPLKTQNVNEMIHF